MGKFLGVTWVLLHSCEMHSDFQPFKEWLSARQCAAYIQCAHDGLCAVAIASARKFEATMPRSRAPYRQQEEEKTD